MDHSFDYYDDGTAVHDDGSGALQTIHSGYVADLPITSRAPRRPPALETVSSSSHDHLPGSARSVGSRSRSPSPASSCRSQAASSYGSEVADRDEIKSVVIIGASGAGKSLLASLLAGNTKKPCFPVSDKATGMTFETTKKDINWLGDIDAEKICIVDTPGLGDPKGKDMDHVANMVKQITRVDKDYRGVNKFLVVVNSQEDRFHIQLQDILTHITTIFTGPNHLPEEWLQHVSIVFTRWAHTERDAQKRVMNREATQEQETGSWFSKNHYGHPDNDDLPLEERELHAQKYKALAFTDQLLKCLQDKKLIEKPWKEFLQTDGADGTGCPPVDNVARPLLPCYFLDSQDAGDILLKKAGGKSMLSFGPEDEGKYMAELHRLRADIEESTKFPCTDICVELNAKAQLIEEVKEKQTDVAKWKAQARWNEVKWPACFAGVGTAVYGAAHTEPNCAMGMICLAGLGAANKRVRQATKATVLEAADLGQNSAYGCVANSGSIYDATQGLLKNKPKGAHVNPYEDASRRQARHQRSNSVPAGSRPQPAAHSSSWPTASASSSRSFEMPPTWSLNAPPTKTI